MKDLNTFLPMNRCNRIKQLDPSRLSSVWTIPNFRASQDFSHKIIALSKRRVGVRRLLLPIILSVLLTAVFLLYAHITLAAAVMPGPRLFAAHALALRSAGVSGSEPAVRLLSAMLGADVVGSKETFSALWGPFFGNTVVKLGRLLSPAPVALYYNPLLDAALFTLWERRSDDFKLVSIRALPGERLVAKNDVVPLLPIWITTKKEPITTLAEITVARLEAFRRTHPAGEKKGGQDDITYASADIQAVLPRLLWNVITRERQAERTKLWLPAALTRINSVLAFRNAKALTVAAPDTDAQTAAALADMPTNFAAQLTLDMVLETDGGDRLLIGSLPEDGDTYVLAHCRLKGDICKLRRFILISLLE